MPMAPELSVIICVYEMAREAPRTIFSAATPYQKNVDPDDYEIIVVDNGSTSPLDLTHLQHIRPTPRVVRYENSSQSPVFALNWAAKNVARGKNLLFAIDGARIFSDHLIANAKRGLALSKSAFVYSLSCHIGPKVQMLSVKEGYDRHEEDRLIGLSRWPQEPTGLYDISVLAGSSSPGTFGCISESNAFAMSREKLEEVGAYDERFVTPGGGLANLELFGRYVSHGDILNVCLLSDFTFHQVHGGAATSGKVDFAVFHDEFVAITGHSFFQPVYEALYLGPLRREAVKLLRSSLDAL